MDHDEASDLISFSTVLTRGQVRRMRDLQTRSSASHRHLSLAHIVREVVEAGIIAVSLELNSGNSASIGSVSKKEPVAA